MCKRDWTKGVHKQRDSECMHAHFHTQIPGRLEVGFGMSLPLKVV